MTMKTIQQNAFTLVEVMVSVILTAILIVTATGIWISCTRGWQFSESQQRQVEKDDLVAQRVRELFERAIIETSSQDHYEWKGENNFDGVAPAGQIQLTTQWPMEFNDGHTLLVPIRGELAMQTSFRGGRGGMPVKELVWKYAPFTSDFKDKDSLEKIVFSTEMQSFKIRYWWKESERWVDAWRENKDWPGAVEVELNFLNPNEKDAVSRQRKFIVKLEEPQTLTPPVSPQPAAPQTTPSTPEEPPKEIPES